MPSALQLLNTVFGYSAFRGVQDEAFKLISCGKFDALVGLAEAAGGRRARLLSYFGEESSACGNCDNRLSPPRVRDGTDAAQKALSCVYRTEPMSKALLRLLVLVGLLIAIAARAESETPVIKAARSWVLAASDLPWTGASPATHGLRLTLVVFRETAWEPDTILAATKNMAPLLAQCGVRIVAAELHLLDAPPRFRYYQTPVSRELARLAPVPRPAIYFVADTLNRPAFDAEAIGRANSGNRPELADTIWVAVGTRDLHVALAHELAHVLMDSGTHSDESGNLMQSETAPENTRLTDSQCAGMRATAERNGLLTLLTN